MESYHRLMGWQRAHALVLAVYEATSIFPTSERSGVTAQLRRAVVSVPVNLAEGVGRTGSRELHRFVTIGLGSLSEVRYLVELSTDLGYLTDRDHGHLQDLIAEVGRLLGGLRRSLE